MAWRLAHEVDPEMLGTASLVLFLPWLPFQHSDLGLQLPEEYKLQLNLITRSSLATLFAVTRQIKLRYVVWETVNEVVNGSYQITTNCHIHIFAATQITTISSQLWLRRVSFTIQNGYLWLHILYIVLPIWVLTSFITNVVHPVHIHYHLLNSWRLLNHHFVPSMLPYIVLPIKFQEVQENQSHLILLQTSHLSASQSRCCFKLW